MIDARLNVASPAVSIDDKTQAAFSKNEGTGQIGLYPLERSHLAVSVLQGQRGSPDIVWDIPNVQFEKEQHTPATFATLLYPYQGETPSFQESALACANSDVWAHSIQTSRETAAVFLARSCNPSAFSASSAVTHGFKATASMLVARSPAGSTISPVLFGALQLSEFSDARMHFFVNNVGNLLFTIRGGYPVISNSGNADVTIRIVKPFARTISIKPGDAVEITRTAEQTLNPAQVFAVASE